VSKVALALSTNKATLSAGISDSLEFYMIAGKSHSSQQYALLCSASGTSPGTVLPGGDILPLNRDFVFDFVKAHIGFPWFAGFYGTIDAAGYAAAKLSTLFVPPALPIGTTLHFAFTTLFPFDFQSNPVAISIVP